MDALTLLLLLFQLVLIASLFIGGVVVLVRPKWYQDRLWARHNAKVQDRLKRGKDAYFEELRTLEAYRPFASKWQQWYTGAVGIGLAIAYAVALYFRVYS